MHKADPETARLIEDSAAALFSRIGVLSGTNTDLDSAWTEIEAAGFTTALRSPESDGVGPEFALLIAIQAGKHAVNAPLTETMAVNWILQTAGMPSVQGRATFSHASAAATATNGGWRITARLNDVPWAERSDHLCVLTEVSGERALVLLRRSEIEVVSGANMAGEARDTCIIDVVVANDRLIKTKAIAVADLRAVGALLRAAQMAGAIAAAQELTLRYATERQQFGRKLTAFQAVQQHLAVMAAQAAAARSATSLGAFALGEALDHRLVACAKVRVGEAAGVVASIAHQVHGAIGFTAEYPLNHFTRRLWTWRDEFGGEAKWATALGDALLASPQALWPQLTTLAAS